MPKSQEQRIKDAAEAMRKNYKNYPSGTWNDIAKVALEAADREQPKPKWPTNESVQAYCAAVHHGPIPEDRPELFETYRPGLRAAMLADPIFKEAMALYERHITGVPNYGAAPLFEAIREAWVHDSGM